MNETESAPPKKPQSIQIYAHHSTIRNSGTHGHNVSNNRNHNHNNIIRNSSAYTTATGRKSESMHASLTLYAIVATRRPAGEAVNGTMHPVLVVLFLRTYTLHWWEKRKSICPKSFFSIQTWNVDKQNVTSEKSVFREQKNFVRRLDNSPVSGCWCYGISR